MSQGPNLKWGFFVTATVCLTEGREMVVPYIPDWARTLLVQTAATALCKFMLALLEMLTFKTPSGLSNIGSIHALEAHQSWIPLGYVSLFCPIVGSIIVPK